MCKEAAAVTITTIAGALKEKTVKRGNFTQRSQRSLPPETVGLEVFHTSRYLIFL
jgi:hypothetical protein